MATAVRFRVYALYMYVKSGHRHSQVQVRDHYTQVLVHTGHLPRMHLNLTSN